jgi:predicted aldo/keto reductase-like oxidoreductase
VNVLAASITLCLSGINISEYFKYFNNAEMFDKAYIRQVDISFLIIFTDGDFEMMIPYCVQL